MLHSAEYQCIPVTVRIRVQPAILEWAINRAGLTVSSLRDKKFKDVERWLSGEETPTLKQLQEFAKKVYVPIGYLFLDQPPTEKSPVPDYRTYDDSRPRRLSPNLIDTLNEIQRRQDWMRDYLIEIGADKLPFVGSLVKGDSIEAAAEKIRTDLGFAPDWAIRCKDIEEARRTLRNAIDNLGILVSVSGFVGSSTHRSLDPEEFCGFALLDDYVPVLFVNNKAPIASQMFTIAHELAHIWLGGDGGLFSLQPIDFGNSSHKNEVFCNKIAAEFLVPKKLFLNKWDRQKKNDQGFWQMAKVFKVSAIVVARRALDLNLITRNHFFSFWRTEKEGWEENKEKKLDKKSGGSPYWNYRVKLGKKFSEAVLSATRSGFLSYSDAFRLTGLRSGTFDEYMSRLKGGKLD